MIRQVVVLALVLLALAQANAFSMQSGPGCGPGNVLEGTKTKFGNVLAGITNVTLFPTYLGALSTGTSGCRSESGVERGRELEELVAGAGPALEQNIAEGHGPYLQAFAGIVGCPDSAFTEFAQWVQASYAAAEVGPPSLREFVFWLDEEIGSHEALSGQCKTGA